MTPYTKEQLLEELAPHAGRFCTNRFGHVREKGSGLNLLEFLWKARTNRNLPAHIVADNLGLSLKDRQILMRAEDNWVRQIVAGPSSSPGYQQQIENFRRDLLLTLDIPLGEKGMLLHNRDRVLRSLSA